MSEDQIRAELLQYRQDDQKQYEKLTEIIHQIKIDTVEAVKEQNEDARKQNDRILSSYKWLVRWIAAVMVCFFGWLAKDHLNLKSSLGDLRTDFGYVLEVSPPDHGQQLMFNIIKNKYNPKRGAGKPDKQGDMMLNNKAVMKNEEEDITI
jgi:hypothetical protein